jgi:hypothetical protein
LPIEARGASLHAGQGTDAFVGGGMELRALLTRVIRLRFARSDDAEQLALERHDVGIHSRR